PFESFAERHRQTHFLDELGDPIVITVQRAADAVRRLEVVTEDESQSSVDTELLTLKPVSDVRSMRPIFVFSSALYAWTVLLNPPDPGRHFCCSPTRPGWISTSSNPGDLSR